MKKKILALCLVVVLAVTAVTGATLAYFTDTDKADNVFVIGNIDIDLEEKQYDHENSQWIDYVDEKPMLPIDDNAGNKLYNKAVNTHNISTNGEPVYIRTLIAVEDPDVGADVGVYSMHVGFNNANATLSNGLTRYGVDYVKHNDMTIDGRNFDVFVCTVLDGSPVQKGEYVQSLHSVWMDENIDAAGAAAYGAKVEVYTFAQGIQAYDLTHEEAMAELGEITNDNLTDWFVIGAAQ